ALVNRHGVDTLDVDDAIIAPCDILAPCALGAVLTVDSVPRLQCAAVCGAANNQLLDDAAADALLARSIVYAPDFVVNAGGIINIAHEWAAGGYSSERAHAAAARIEATTRGVFELARHEGVNPAKAAAELGRRRIERDGQG